VNAADPTRPAAATDDLLQFLDELRESGITDMTGAPLFLSRAHGISIEEAREALTYWTDTYPRRK
jgi:hypothetical protein